MKKFFFRKSTAILLAVLIAFSALAVSAAASAGDSMDEAVVVAGDFTAKASRSKAAYYKFVPDQSGYYNIYSEAKSYDPVLQLYYRTGAYLDHSDNDGEGRNFSLMFNFTAGETYYLALRLYGAKTAKAFGVKIEYCGQITDVDVVSTPPARNIIMGFGCGAYGDDSGWINFSYNGFEVNLTFESGKEMTFVDWEVERFFDTVYGKPVVGENVIRFKHCNELIFTWNITVIENPVASVEVARLPDKSTYIYKVDGDFSDGGFYGTDYFYPYMDYTGLTLKINLKDGTSKTAVYNESYHYMADYDDDNLGFYYGDTGWGWFIGGYRARVDCYRCTIGQNDVRVNYLGKQTTFKINVVRPTARQNLLLWLAKVTAFFAHISFYKSGIWDEIGWWLENLANRV